MNWIELKDEAQLDTIREQSQTTPVVIFKHSTRCSISAMAKNRMERATPPDGIAFYYLDLIQYRSLSNRVAEDFGVHHESPQVILIHKGECVYDESHNGIDMREIAAQVTA
jgi:bacillithiol system protein YtxJ